MFTIIYTRKDEKKHSVTFAEETIGRSPSTSLPSKVLGTIYVAKESGLTSAKKLKVTIEAVE